MLRVLGTRQGMSAYSTLIKPQLNIFFRSEVQVVRNFLKFNEFSSENIVRVHFCSVYFIVCASLRDH